MDSIKFDLPYSLQLILVVTVSILQLSLIIYSTLSKYKINKEARSLMSASSQLIESGVVTGKQVIHPDLSVDKNIVRLVKSIQECRSRDDCSIRERVIEKMTDIINSNEIKLNSLYVIPTSITKPRCALFKLSRQNDVIMVIEKLKSFDFKIDVTSVIYQGDIDIAVVLFVRYEGKEIYSRYTDVVINI